MIPLQVDPANYKQEYIDNREKNQRESTVEAKRLTIRHFTEYCQEHGHVLNTDDVYASLDIIRDFFDADRLTISGTRLSHLRDFIEFIAHRTTDMREQDKLFDLQDKVTAKRFPREMFESKEEHQEKEPEFLSDDEIAAACREADDRTELVIRFLFDTGCRIGEMLGVTRADVDFEHEEVAAAVRIDKKRTRDGKTELPKTDAGNRTVELTAETVEMLRDWIDENQFDAGDDIFPHSEKTYSDNLKAAFTAAGLWINDGSDADQYKVGQGKSFVSPHWLRHNRNTRLKKRLHPAELQQYMGHEEMGMSDHYTEFDPEEVQGVIGND